MSENLSLTFSALADPTRRAILSQLTQGQATVSELAEPFLKEMSLPALTKHIKVLERAGLITKSKEAQYRPCKINHEALKEVADWVEQYRMFWEESFDRLGEYLKTVAPPKKQPKGKNVATKSKSNELQITRVYDAPVTAVWDAWADPAQAVKWWGPRGFTITTHSKDLKSGGHWHYTMHGPDGTDYPNHTVYHEVEEPRLLVYDHGGFEDRPPLFRVTVKFADLGDQTKMEMTMVCPSAEAAEQTRKFIKEAQGNSTWDRLAEYLEKKKNDRDVFIINRSFDIPLERMFAYWIEPTNFAEWLGPKGSQMEILEGSIKEGDTLFYKVVTPQAPDSFGKASYLAIRGQDYLEYIQSFRNEAGEVIKHPFIQKWPDFLSTKVFFSAEGPDQCRITVIWEPHGKFSADELNTFAAMRAECTTGWNQAFDRLEEILT